MRNNGFKGYLALALAVALVLSFAFDASAQIFGTNLQKGDKNYSKGGYQKAYDFYAKAAADYQSRLGKAYTDTKAAQADAAKLAEAYYKMGLSIQKMRPKDPAVLAMFEKAAVSQHKIKQGYYEKQEVLVPAGYVDRWIPGFNKKVYVDGRYEEVFREGATKDVWVDGHYESKQVWVDKYKEVWVDGYYKQDGTYVKGHYRTIKDGGYYKTEQVWVDGFYKKEQLPGYYEKVWKDGYYKDEWVEAHYEKVYEPEHYETKSVYKEREAVIKSDGAHQKLAAAEVAKRKPQPVRQPPKPATTTPATAKPAATATTSSARAPQAETQAAEGAAADAAAVSGTPDLSNPAVKAAFDRMNQSYQEFVQAGMPAEGPALDKYKAALELYQKALEAAKK